MLFNSGATVCSSAQNKGVCTEASKGIKGTQPTGRPPTQDGYLYFHSKTKSFEQKPAKESKGHNRQDDRQLKTTIYFHSKTKNFAQKAAKGTKGLDAIFRLA
jgi:hypothetical protein